MKAKLSSCGYVFVPRANFRRRLALCRSFWFPAQQLRLLARRVWFPLALRLALLDPAVDAELAGWLPPSRILPLPLGFPCSVGQARHLRATEKEEGSHAEPSAAPVLPLGLGKKEAGARSATFAAAA